MTPAPIRRLRRASRAVSREVAARQASYRPVQLLTSLAARHRQFVAGLPGGRPRIAEVAGANAERRGGQANLGVTGEIEIDRQARRDFAAIRRQSYRQQRQNAIFLAAVKTAIGRARDVVERHTAQSALERSGRQRPAAGAATLPTEAVGDQQEDPRARI